VSDYFEIDSLIGFTIYCTVLHRNNITIIGNPDLKRSTL